MGDNGDNGFAPLLAITLHGTAKHELQELGDGSTIAAGYSCWLDRRRARTVQL